MGKVTVESMCEKYEEFLIDESKYGGWAKSISFPETETEVCEILRQMALERVPVTIQGGKTGITGGAVPRGGHILNLSRMNRVLDTGKREDGPCVVTVEPGVTLLDLEKAVLKAFGREKVFWPVQPTEKSATVGGIAATGAQGPNEYAYGDSSQYILEARMACADGSVVTLTGDSLGEMLGREGIAGVFTALTLRLAAKPEDLWGICFFFSSEDQLSAFADFFNEKKWEADQARLTVAEYLDRETVKRIQERKQDMAKIRELPDVDEAFEGMVYLEIEGSSDGIEELAEELMELAAEHGSDPDEAWALSGETEVEKLRAFRHAAAESVNLNVEANRKGEAKITKLATDFLWNQPCFSQVLEGYRRDLADSGIEHVIFGHVKGSHLHVNLLPKTEAEFEQGSQILRSWGEKCKAAGGVLTGEHGVGKLKRPLLEGLLPEADLALCARLKETYDPSKLLNQGDISDWEE
ncbi:MAG: FAD-binding oxidoreductase [Blautia sp.]